MTLPTLPDISVDIAFGTNPFATPTWTSVTDYVRAVSFSRGRQYELDRIEAGTGQLLLDNRDRRFDPTNTAGPYYPNILPMRRVRVRATWAAVTHDLFHGYVEAYSQEYPDPSADAVVAVRFVDAFKVLALRKLSASFASALSGARVTAVLDNIGWPAADRSIDVGQTTLQAATLTDVVVLQHLQDVADTELGTFFVARAGKLNFADRHRGILLAADYPNHTWGDAGTEFPYKDIAIPEDEGRLWNDITVQRTGGVAQVVSDAASQGKYGVRTLQRTGLLMTTDTDALDQAHFLLTRFSEPTIRADRIVIDGQSDTNAWPHLLHHDIGDKVRLRRRPPGGGAVLEQDSFIEGISMAFTPRSGIVTWNLSAVDRQVDYWVMDDPNQSLMGETTRMGY